LTELRVRIGIRLPELKTENSERKGWKMQTQKQRRWFGYIKAMF